MNTKEQVRHSMVHLLGYTLKEIYPDAQGAVGQVTENGFFYDVDFSVPISDKDLVFIGNKMREAINRGYMLKQKSISKANAEKIFENDLYKLELIREKGEEEVSICILDTFTDLCFEHQSVIAEKLPIDSFKVEKLAGAYWRGNEKNKQLTRISGLSFPSKEELLAYEFQQEEAKKRDHRKLGKVLKLFTISDLIGAGLPLLQPKGMVLRKEIEDYLWDLHKGKGYSRVWTPHITKIGLYETSGHAAKFGNELFRVKGGDEEFFMKPMNCPHHMQIFCDNQFSYRDMPVRYFEPATVYRYEKAGELSGLTRVRSITQDDGHLFCRISQISTEVTTIVQIIKEFYTTMNMLAGYWVRLSVRGDNKDAYLGSDEVWGKAEAALEDAAMENGLNYKRVEGEAAFYGPKLDFIFKDAIGREWQLATIQCDFNLPERFDLSFTNEKGEKERPVVIHRAISGSLERFMGVMIEHFAGNFPVWLSPVQVKIIPVRESHNEYARKIADAIEGVDIRVEFDDSDIGMGKKIRAGKNDRVPYMIIIGDKEISDDILTVERRDGAQEKTSLESFIATVKEEIKQRVF